MRFSSIARCAVIAVLLFTFLATLSAIVPASAGEDGTAGAQVQPQVSHASASEDTLPVAVLYDCSQSSAPAVVRLQARQSMAALLSTLHPGTPFVLIAFNGQPALVYRGIISPQDAAGALAALDSVKHRGATDLGAAIDFVLQQPSFAKGGSMAIISDFYLSQSPNSKFVGKPLLTLLDEAHARSIRHVLLLPVGTLNVTSVQLLPAYARLLHKGESPADWVDQIAVPKPATPPPPTRPFWTRGAFLFSAVLAALLLAGALVARRRLLRRRIARELMQDVSAPGLLFEEPIVAASAMPSAEANKPLRLVFRILTVEDGLEVALDATPFAIGANPSANRYIPAALTTLTVFVKAGARACTILNSGGKPAYIGRKLLQAREAFQLPAQITAQCRLTQEVTVAIFSTLEEEVRDERE